MAKSIDKCQLVPISLVRSDAPLNMKIPSPKAKTKILECESWCYDTRITSLAAEWWTLGAWPVKSGLARRYAARMLRGVMVCCCEDRDCRVQMSYYSKCNYGNMIIWTNMPICMQKNTVDFPTWYFWLLTKTVQTSNVRAHTYNNPQAACFESFISSMMP